MLYVYTLLTDLYTEYDVTLKQKSEQTIWFLKPTVRKHWLYDNHYVCFVGVPFTTLVRQQKGQMSPVLGYIWEKIIKCTLRGKTWFTSWYAGSEA